MLQKIIGNKIVTTPFFRFETDSGVALDPVFTAVGGTTFQWINPDGSISTGTTPNPVLDQIGRYVVKCNNWAGITIIAFTDDHISAMENLHVFTALTTLRCFTNSLTVLDVTPLTTLTILSCHTNASLSVLDVSGLTVLEQLLCNNCSISILDVSALTLLTKLRCEDNSITSLDLALCTVLTDIRCGNNGMNEAAVDNVLAGLVTAAAINGTAILAGTNAAPSAAGLANKAILEGRGWTVTTN